MHSIRSLWQGYYFGGSCCLGLKLIQYGKPATQQRAFSSCRLICRISSSSVMDSATENGEWQQRKQETLKMPIEKRRELYRCGAQRAVNIESIPTWPEYAVQQKLVEAVDDGVVGVGNKVSVFKGDITCLEIDAIVNAANESLLGGGGVDGAIHKAAGYMLYDECHTLDGCDTGDAKITGGYNLPARYVIHTVGPQRKDSDLLASCYTRSLELARQNNLRTIAFPCISTGIYGYPNGPACQTALRTVRKWLEAEDNSSNVDRIIFCVFLDIDVRCYQKYMPVVFPLTAKGNKADADELNESKLSGTSSLAEGSSNTPRSSPTKERPASGTDARATSGERSPDAGSPDAKKNKFEKDLSPGSNSPQRKEL